MLPGVYSATKKDGSIYFRSSITYRGKHISLGSYLTETDANAVYEEARLFLNDRALTVENLPSGNYRLSFERMVSLINFRDNDIYFKTPIFLRPTFFHYYLSPTIDLKFDTDDLFYYSSHRILQRNGHLYVNDYGMQYSILNRYGIKNYSVEGRDYIFANGDHTDYRYSNIIIVNPYYGVTCESVAEVPRYKTRIHINGNYLVGTFSSEIEAAIAYNKAVDLAREHGITRNYPENYIDNLSPREYANIYSSIKLSKKYMDYLKEYAVS